MHKTLITLAAAAVLIPFAASALDYTDSTERYSDAPFSRAESAGISVLTNVGATEGNPDGTFSPSRLLNRAEFLKILLIAAKDETSPETLNCFPDVHASAWYAPYVCAGKDLDVAKGNPDGTFRPERSVNLAEAVTMAVRLWKLTLPTYIRAPDHWYDPYMVAARSAGIPVDVYGAPDHLLTRGEMARLAASFLAASNGELDAYLDAERGVFHSSSSSSVSSSSSSSVSSSSSSVTSSSSSSVTSSSSSSANNSSTRAGFPARSHFLVAGERSQAIASATFFANLEPLFVRGAEIRLHNKIEGIDAMFIVDSSGAQIGQVYLDKVYDTTEKTWRGTFAASGAYRLPKSENRVLGVEIRMKARNQGGTSEEMVQVDSFGLSTEGEWSQNNATTNQNVLPYPKNQTAMGRITSVANTLATNEALSIGPNQLLAGFRITGSAVPGASLRIEHLEFQISKSSSVTVTNWQIGIQDSSERWSCSTSGDLIVSCTSIPESLGTLGMGDSARVFRLYGDVALASGATDKTLQVSLNQAGSVDEIGAVRWTDGTGHFNWIELESPIARSTRFN